MKLRERKKYKGGEKNQKQVNQTIKTLLSQRLRDFRAEQQSKATAIFKPTKPLFLVNKLSLDKFICIIYNGLV